MKNKLSIIVILSAICLSCGLYLLNHSHSNNETVNSERELYQMGKELNEQLAGRKISDIACTDSMGNTVMLSDLMAGNKVLVYYYSELHCSSCYESYRDLLENNISKKDFPVVILGSYLNFRHFSVYLKRHFCSLPIYWVEHNAFKWELDNSGVPYCFVLNLDMTVSYFYVPQNEYPAVDKLYLERVQTLISSN